MSAKSIRNPKQLLAYLALVVATSVALIGVQNTASTADHSAQEARQAIAAVKHVTVSDQTFQDALYGSCHRLNLLRATYNDNSLQDYKLFSNVIKLVTVTNNNKKVPYTKQQRAARQTFIDNMKTDVAAKTWTPLTNCNKAVNQPGSFTPPKQIHFETKLPPKSALTLGPTN